ncbi:MAG: NTP transferase domain-containing protein [Oscillospiraceae bacterium]|nr:NTP transferase domain-containing protein [Oscillospiraceae bacterium]
MSATLVIMAAGLASRYGSAKQIEKVGPADEILMEYTIRDAQKAGFDRFVIILPPGMEPEFREVCGDRLQKAVTVDYAVQSFKSLPAWFTLPEGRTKPYGTVPAVLSAAEKISGRFAVVNADDYYGPGAYGLMYDALRQLPGEGAACMVAYKLKNTVSTFGTVTRGVCRVEGGRMTAVKETYKIGLAPDGSIRSYYTDEAGTPLDAESAVSMNFWGFTPWALGRMEEYFDAFLRSEAGERLDSECLLPTMVGDMIDAGTLEVAACTTDETWFGMTYREDRATTARMLGELTARGVYPAVLFP